MFFIHAWDFTDSRNAFFSKDYVFSGNLNNFHLTNYVLCIYQLDYNSSTLHLDTNNLKSIILLWQLSTITNASYFFPPLTPIISQNSFLITASLSINDKMIAFLTFFPLSSQINSNFSRFFFFRELRNCNSSDQWILQIPQRLRKWLTITNWGIVTPQPWEYRCKIPLRRSVYEIRKCKLWCAPRRSHYVEVHY